MATYPYCSLVAEGYLVNALLDAHCDDPEFGHRYLGDEVRDSGHVACDRTMWRICWANGLMVGVRQEARRERQKPGPPVHDDMVNRDFTAEAPNQLWLADITEHWTRDGKFYLCANKDVFCNRIVGYSISEG